MSFLEKQRHGNHNYYYLVKNVRISSSKVKTFRVSLGRIVPSHNKLQQYFIALEKKSSVFKAKWLGKEEIEKLEDLRASIIVFHKTPEKVIPSDFLVRFTYNTNAIEGNRLTLRQTSLILADRITPEGARTEDVLETFNAKDAWEFIKSYKGKIDNKLLRRVQYEVTKNTSCRIQGDYRDSEVRISGSDWKPPKAEKIPLLLKNVFEDYKKQKDVLHPIELASWLHNKLVQIHPFTDGNGRTSRLIMNWLLLKNKFPPIIIEVKNKEKYYKMIEEGDSGKDASFAHFLSEQMLEQYTSIKL